VGLDKDQSSATAIDTKTPAIMLPKVMTNHQNTIVGLDTDQSKAMAVDTQVPITHHHLTRVTTSIRAVDPGPVRNR
jgi:hypothetical protein